MAVKDILPKEDIDFIIQKAREYGALISYKTAEDGTEIPYEINTTWFSALNKQDNGEDIAFQCKRFVASRVIALVLQGVPGIYLHSLLGTPNDIGAVLVSDSKRAINRTVIDGTSVLKALKDPLSRTSRVNRELGRLIAIRTKHRAFHPNGEQHILTLSNTIFSVYRISPEGDQRILTLTNVTGNVCKVEIPLSELHTQEAHWYDIVSGMEWMAENQTLYLTLFPYDVIWLTPNGERVED
jgi:sucrose phosphorylase